MVELLTLSDFEKFETVGKKELSLIAFGTPWSSPCRVQQKILVKLMQRYGNIMVFGIVDVEQHPGIAGRCQIQTVPTLIVYRKGKELKRLVGLQSVETLDAILAKSCATKASRVQNRASTK